MSPRLAVDQLHRAALERGEAEALVADGARFTYVELAAEADRVAALLQSLGLAPGGRVVVVLANSAASVTTLFGVWRAGGCVVMGDADSTPAKGWIKIWVIPRASATAHACCPPAPPKVDRV